MKYEIKTITDILKAVTTDNVDNFLKDFTAWLAFTLISRGLSDQMRTDGVGYIKETEGFTWIDDGKNDAIIRVQVRQEEKLEPANPVEEQLKELHAQYTANVLELVKIYDKQSTAVCNYAIKTGNPIRPDFLSEYMKITL